MINTFMNNAKGLTKNPLGIIALFISLIYGFACLVLSTSISNLNGENERMTLIWFIIIFPLIILSGFIFLVIKHHEKLYAPSDYSDEESFLKTFRDKIRFQETNLEVTKENINDETDLTEVISKSDNKDFNNVLFSDKAKQNLSLANQSFNFVKEELSFLMDKNIISRFTFGVQSPEYYLYELTFNQTFFKQNATRNEAVIMRVTELTNNKYAIVGIGKGIIEENPEQFAIKLKQYIDKRILKKWMKEEEYNKLPK